MKLSADNEKEKLERFLSCEGHLLLLQKAGLMPSSNIVGHKHPYSSCRGSTILFWPWQVLHAVHTYILAGTVFVHIK